MTRQTGVFAFADNFECSLSAPLDARMTTPSKSQLTSLPGKYLGMIVVVTSDTTTDRDWETAFKVISKCKYSRLS